MIKPLSNSDFGSFPMTALGGVSLDIDSMIQQVEEDGTKLMSLAHEYSSLVNLERCTGVF